MQRLEGSRSACPLTIVMYHYVRDLERSRFPEIKGLRLDRFVRQLDFIQSHYTPVAVEDLRAAIADAACPLPPNAILLTFDDGFIDHFVNVFPLLDARGIRGCFFPAGASTMNHKVLDVHKIQFTLATVSDTESLMAEVASFIDEFRLEYGLRPLQEYIGATGEHRYDKPEVVVLKRLLQREFPLPVRTEIVRRLFNRHVTGDEAAFACELYMSMEQIRCMKRHGMHVGGHTWSHEWLNYLSPEKQSQELDQTMRFLNSVAGAESSWSLCYPYGGYNDATVRLARERNCELGFTVEARVADLSTDDPLLLPRIDTNDLPS